VKILVVEDDSRKGDAIISLLQSDIADVSVTLVRSYQSGLRAATESAPDVLILDMSLPNYDTLPGKRSGKPRPLGGFEIMRKLRRRGQKTMSIVLTQLDHFGDGGQEYNFEGLEKKCQLEFPDTFLGSIYYAQSSSDWKGRVVEIVKGLQGGEN
jgi:CheY-like chemotaxis protein